MQPLQVRISGASNQGLVSLSTLTVLSVKDSWDPEEATTGLHAAHGFKATWRVEEIGEQPFCSLTELRLLSLEERDLCSQAYAGCSLWDKYLGGAQLTRDFDRLPAAIQLSARSQAGSRWNTSVSDNCLAVKREVSLVFTLEAGPQWDLTGRDGGPIL
jgi:hypothetical protein